MKLVVVCDNFDGDLRSLMSDENVLALQPVCRQHVVSWRPRPRSVGAVAGSLPRWRQERRRGQCKTVEAEHAGPIGGGTQGCDGIRQNGPWLAVALQKKGRAPVCIADVD